MPGMDELDLQILDSLMAGLKGKQIAAKLGRPMSTVQRRARKLFESGAVSTKVRIDYAKLGLKRGNLFVYLKNGDTREVASGLAKMLGIASVSIHIGNADVVAEFMYRDSADLLEFIQTIKNNSGVDKVVWSEEVYKVPLSGVHLTTT